MAYYTYSNSTGELVEISDFPLSAQEDLAASYVENLTRFQLEQYQWDPNIKEFMNTPRRIFEKREFIKRFTLAEFTAIKTAAVSNAIVDYYWQILTLSDKINLNDPDNIAAMEQLVQQGVLTEARKQEILA